jgi:uncharacterized membrane protein YeaQ/YmgE (transglycosylase-associated protein family)
MTILEFLILLLIAGLCGSIAQALSGYSHAGCFGSIALGLIGALLGAWLARALSLPEILAVRIGDQNFPIVWSIIGAAIFSSLLGLLSRRRTGECFINAKSGGSRCPLGSR